jgi:hypothetical protein
MARYSLFTNQNNQIARRVLPAMHVSLNRPGFELTPKSWTNLKGGYMMTYQTALKLKAVKRFLDGDGGAAAKVSNLNGAMLCPLSGKSSLVLTLTYNKTPRATKYACQVQQNRTAATPQSQNLKWFV